MTRIHRILGVAAMLCFAMSAAVVTSASAEATTAKLTAASYPVTLHGDSKDETTTITTEGGSVHCGTTLTGQLSEASQTFTLTPTLVDCEAFGFLSATVTTDGCGYLYHITTKVAADNYLAHFDLHCPAGKAITVTAATCSLEIKPQTGLTTVDVENMTMSVNDVTLTDTVVGVSYTVTKDGFLCPFGGTGNKTGGSFSSTAPTTLTGTNSTGDPIGIHVG